MKGKYLSLKVKTPGEMLFNDQQFIVAGKDHDGGVTFVGSTGDGDCIRFVPIKL